MPGGRPFDHVAVYVIVLAKTMGCNHSKSSNEDSSMLDATIRRLSASSSRLTIGYLQGKMMADSEIISSASLRVRQAAERATLIFLTSSLYERLFGHRLHVSYSLGDGCFMVNTDHTPITQDQVDQLESGVRALIASTPTLEEVSVPRQSLHNMFKASGRTDKIGVLKTIYHDPVPCVQCGSFIDYILEPMQADLSKLPVFCFRLYESGFLLRFPGLLSPNKLRDWVDPSAQFKMLQEYVPWTEVIGIDSVAKLNDLVYHKEFDQVKWVCEGLHQKKFAEIAGILASNFPAKRIVTIAGPSSSNKTTFAKRLAISLKVRGFDSLVIEMDDFFVNITETPYGPDGLQDFEALSALNTTLLKERVRRLLAGESVPSREYDFRRGIGFDIESSQQSLPAKGFLILEGIHGLNSAFLEGMDRSQVTAIFVSALPPISIDSTHRFPSTDLRLIRRIIRDHRYRGASARKTLRRWTSVRVGEEKNIFPFIGNADVFFNSSLVYELPVTSIFARSLLAEATVPEPGEDPKNPLTVEITREAKRLLGLVNLFYAISAEEVPHISCIREFVGGSELDY
jgi:uridine kinase